MKYLALIAAGFLALALTGCGEQDNKPVSTTESTTTTTTQQAPASAPASAPAQDQSAPAQNQ